MELINIKDLYRRKEEYLEQEVSIGGWVRSVRNSKNFGFIVVNDGTFFEPLQVVYHDGLANFAEVEKLMWGLQLSLPGNWSRPQRRSSLLRFRQKK